MAYGNNIVIPNEPKGVWLEGIVSGTPSPGTVMQVKAGETPESGRFTWQAFDADADGDQRLIAVLTEDRLQGKTAEDAYTDGSRCFLYCPLPGEELNMLVKNLATGTGESFAIGDILMVDDGTGVLIDATSSPESEPFVVAEEIVDLTIVQENFLVHCIFTGY